jgi:antitoxin HicB
MIMSEVSLSYPAKIVKKTDDGIYYQVTFRDIENCFTQGETKEEAYENAQDVLGFMLQDYVEDDLPLPKPSKVRKGELLISPLPEIAAPLLIYLARTYRCMTQVQAAKLLGITKQRYSDIERGKNLTMKTLGKAAKVIGYKPSLVLSAIHY